MATDSKRKKRKPSGEQEHQPTHEHDEERKLSMPVNIHGPFGELNGTFCFENLMGTIYELIVSRVWTALANERANINVILGRTPAPKAFPVEWFGRHPESAKVAERRFGDFNDPLRDEDYADLMEQSVQIVDEIDRECSLIIQEWAHRAIEKGLMNLFDLCDAVITSRLNDVAPAQFEVRTSPDERRERDRDRATQVVRGEFLGRADVLDEIEKRSSLNLSSLRRTGRTSNHEGDRRAFEEFCAHFKKEGRRAVVGDATKAFARLRKIKLEAAEQRIKRFRAEDRRIKGQKGGQNN